MRIKCGYGATRCWVTAKTSNWEDFHTKDSGKSWADRAREAASVNTAKVAKQKEAMNAKIRKLNVKIEATRQQSIRFKHYTT